MAKRHVLENSKTVNFMTHINQAQLITGSVGFAIEKKCFNFSERTGDYLERRKYKEGCLFIMLVSDQGHMSFSIDCCKLNRNDLFRTVTDDLFKESLKGRWEFFSKATHVAPHTIFICNQFCGSWNDGKLHVYQINGSSQKQFTNMINEYNSAQDQLKNIDDRIQKLEDAKKIIEDSEFTGPARCNLKEIYHSS